MFFFIFIIYLLIFFHFPKINLKKILKNFPVCNNFKTCLKILSFTIIYLSFNMEDLKEKFINAIEEIKEPKSGKSSVTNLQKLQLYALFK